MNYVDLVLDSLDLEYELVEDLTIGNIKIERKVSTKEKLKKSAQKRTCQLLKWLLKHQNYLEVKCGKEGTAHWVIGTAKKVSSKIDTQIRTILKKVKSKQFWEQIQKAIKESSESASERVKKELQVLKKVSDYVQAIDARIGIAIATQTALAKSKIKELVKRLNLSDRAKKVLEKVVENPAVYTNLPAEEKQLVKKAVEEIKTEKPKEGKVIETAIKTANEAEKDVSKLVGNKELAERIKRALSKFFKEGSYLAGFVVAFLGAGLIVIALKLAGVRIEPFSKMTWKLAWERLGLPGKILLVLGIVMVLAGIYSAGLKLARNLLRKG